MARPVKQCPIDVAEIPHPYQSLCEEFLGSSGRRPFALWMSVIILDRNDQEPRRGLQELIHRATASCRVRCAKMATGESRLVIRWFECVDQPLPFPAVL